MVAVVICYYKLFFTKSEFGRVLSRLPWPRRPRREPTPSYFFFPLPVAHFWISKIWTGGLKRDRSADPKAAVALLAACVWIVASDGREKEGIFPLGLALNKRESISYVQGGLSDRGPGLMEIQQKWLGKWVR